MGHARAREEGSTRKAEGLAPAMTRWRRMLLAADRIVAREAARPAPIVLMVGSVVAFIASWTGGLQAFIGAQQAFTVGLLAPAAFATGARLRSGRSWAAALSWTLPYAGAVLISLALPRPFDALLTLVTNLWLVSMLLARRVISWWEAMVLRSAPYGRLEWGERLFHDNLEALLDEVVAYGMQVERGRLGRDELVARLAHAEERALALEAPDEEWAMVRHHLIQFLHAATVAAREGFGSARQVDAQKRASDNQRAYEMARRTLVLDRLRPWRGLELV